MHNGKDALPAPVMPRCRKKENKIFCVITNLQYIYIFLWKPFFFRFERSIGFFVIYVHENVNVIHLV